MNKTNNPIFKRFLEKYMKRNLPPAETLRKYVKPIYLDKLEEVRKVIGNDYIAISLDETTDAAGRLVAGFVIQSLEKPNCGPFLTNVEELGRAKTENIVQFILDSLEDFYGDEG